MRRFKEDYSDVRGFMYEPSYAWTEVECWQNFNPKIIEQELGRGKKYFPKMNAIRTCVFIDAFKRDPNSLIDNFGKLLDIAENYDLAVMPMLFNRWHNFLLDFGGIYVDHFWTGRYEEIFETYVRKIVGKYADDDRIMMWDICNEPFHHIKEFPKIKDAEFKWLKNVYETCKSVGAKAPLCVGMHQAYGIKGLELVEPISDVLTIHAYYRYGEPKSRFEKRLDEYVAFSRRIGKPLLVTETCWGAPTDEERVEIIKYSLEQLKKRGIGFFAVMLHWSVRIDCHGPESGLPVGGMFNLEFIEKDGSLRKGHEIFNKY